MNPFNAAVIATLPILTVACGQPAPERTPPGSPASAPSAPAAASGEPIATSGGAVKDDPVQQHNVSAKIVALAPERRMVTLDHEEIPGVMAAKKMEYNIANTAMLQGLAPGDQVIGRLEERAGTYVIVSLQKR
jgi:Cu/Ag efflux protein CusF